MDRVVDFRRLVTRHPQEKLKEQIEAKLEAKLEQGVKGGGSSHQLDCFR